MSINPAIFRAYDIRGIYPQDLNGETAKLIGQAIGSEALAVIRLQSVSGMTADCPARH